MQIYVGTYFWNNKNESADIIVLHFCGNMLLSDVGCDTTDYNSPIILASCQLLQNFLYEETPMAISNNNIFTIIWRVHVRWL